MEEYEPEALDHFLTAHVQLPIGDEVMLGTVIAHMRDAHGNLVGRSSINPIFDTRVYQVQFPDDRIEEYRANIIVENLYSQVDKEGNQFLLVDKIIDHEYNETQANDPNNSESFNMQGWSLCMLWKNGNTSWEKLKDMKRGFPIEAAKYAISKGLDKLPAFEWWVKQTIKRKDCIIKAVKTRYMKCTHKFRLRLPKSVKEAYKIDQETGMDLWH
jgi:hypothetical protein